MAPVAFVVDALAFDSILLVSDAHGGFVGLVELCQWGIVWDDVALFPECDVLDSEWLGLTHVVLGVAARVGVFTNSKQVEEGNGDQVCDCLASGGHSFVGIVSSLQEGRGDGDRDRQFVVSDWVLFLIVAQLQFEPQDIFLRARPILVYGVMSRIQHELRADGSQCFFD